MKSFENIFYTADISETALSLYDNQTFNLLLFDHTSGGNILWGTDDYMVSPDDKKRSHDSQILGELITGENDNLIRPRALKTEDQQRARSKVKAEVFTPAWVCNAQNNIIDEEWFGYPNAFNMTNSNKDNPHLYILMPRKEKDSEQKVIFPHGKKWQDYVSLNRLEVSCGEAPYLVNRYDSSGSICRIRHNVRMRIGILDRKLRVICENTSIKEEWYAWVLKAYRHCYGFEWQGDSLLLARENMLLTFFDFYRYKFKTKDLPDINFVRKIAEIISWNLWQMDGLTLQRPYSSFREFDPNPMFPEDNKDFCKIMDWETGKEIYFASLVKK